MTTFELTKVKTIDLTREFFYIVYDAVEKPGFFRTNTFFWSKKIDTL